MSNSKSTDSSTKKKISFDIQPKLLEELEAQRKETGFNRSNWICMAIMEKLARDREK